MKNDGIESSDNFQKLSTLSGIKSNKNRYYTIFLKIEKKLRLINTRLLNIHSITYD